MARWSANAFDVGSLNQAAITRVTPLAHEQALVIDASCVPKSGQKTYGRDRCWHGRHGRRETGLEISALAGLDITANCASSLSVEQTPPTSDATAPETTRSDVYREPLTRVVSAQDWGHLREVMPEGYDSQPPFIPGVHACGRHPRGTRRIEAHRRELSHGPKRLGPGRPKTYDGKVHWDDLTRVEPLETADDPLVRSHQGVTHVQLQGNLRVVRGVETKHHRRAVLLSPDLDGHALTIDRSDKARFPMEFLCRDAPQFTGLCDSQARAHAPLDFHCKASLTAVTLAKLEARQQHGDAMASCSLARLKRRAFNQPLIDRIGEHCAKGHRVEKSCPDDEELCHDGSMTA